MNLNWQLCSETCLTAFLPAPVTLENQQICWGLADRIHQLEAVIEVVVGMNTLSVYTQALSATELLEVQQQLHLLSQGITKGTISLNKKITGKHVKIPVRYGGEYGPDLVSCAQAKNISPHELVAKHTQPIYTVYFIGFQPGFPYLGGLPDELAMPRHAIPRLQVPAGSVGIGGSQTGIYPFASPGGWQLLGQTDLPLFDLQNPEPTLLKAGDTLSFVAIEVIE